MFKALNSDLGHDHEWEQALYHQHDKNDAVPLVAPQPTLIENVPNDQKVLPAIMNHVFKSEDEGEGLVSASY